ncbi:hypothetical protein [Moorella sp. ACPs]|uniref:hypothetical protein n=1 Tax=Neomoorella carbonis TaxID=3062783 RepID=UPI003247F1D1
MSYASRYIAICDILGFKKYVQDNPLQDVVASFSKLLDKAKKLSEHERHTVSTQDGYKLSIDSIPFIVFSDTILMWVEAECDPDSWLNIPNFFDSLGALVAVSITCGLPLRVGIAYGECYINPSEGKYLGQPIVNAYLTEEAQDWIGGACHSSCLAGPYFEAIQEKLCLVVPYIVPTKPEVRVGELQYALEWVSWAAPSADISLRHMVNCTYDDRIRRKYANALNFYHVVRPPKCLIT